MAPPKHLQRYYQDPRVAEQWFAGAWQDPQQWSQWPLQAWHGDRQALAAIATAAVDAAAGDAHSRAQAQALGKDGVLAVVAGQQPAYALGPVYNLLKAAHCIAVAQHLSQQGQPAVPVFWCASDDHDHDEAAGCRIIQRDGRLRALHRPMAPRHCALRRVSAQPGWEELLQALAELPGSALGRSWIHEHAPRQDEDMGAWMCRVMSALSAGSGLVCIEAWRLRPLWGDGIKRALSHWPREALQQRQVQLQAADWPNTLGDLSQAPLFADRADQRQALDPAAAQRLWQEDPSMLSPGAALRPVLQQLALPAAIYCAGPGEITYHAALGPLYPALAAHAPRLIPRLSLGLIPSWVRRGLDAWGLQADDLNLSHPLPEQPLDGEDQRILEIFSQAQAQLAAQENSLDQLRSQRIASARERLQQQAQQLELSLMRAQRQRQQRPALGTLRDYLFPRGGAQDRTLSSAQAIWQWGPGVFAELLQRARQHPLGGNRGWTTL